MKSKISAMMDGELAEAELAESMHALREDGVAIEAWREYHLISDALRDTQILSSGFSARFAVRLEQEPAILAPAAAPKRAERGRYRFPLAMAASVAGVALVGSIVYMQWQADPQVARAPVPVQAESVAVAMPKEADDYLRAHQNYSPRNSLQGVAPYVRTVSETPRSR